MFSDNPQGNTQSQWYNGPAYYTYCLYNSYVHPLDMITLSVHDNLLKFICGKIKEPMNGDGHGHTDGRTNKQTNEYGVCASVCVCVSLLYCVVFILMVLFVKHF